MIPPKLLIERGGSFRKYLKNQSVFFEGDMPHFYYQVVYGNIRTITFNENGKEYLYDIFKNEESFGGADLLIGEPYPASAVANVDTLLIKIRKEEFINILKEFPEIQFEFMNILARKIYNKSLMAKAISNKHPEQSVLSIFKILKDTYGIPGKKNYKIELSRQQIADMIGFRVETVIRTIKRLERQNIFKISKGKIYI
jgi:CRP-like cAMP-binding protein